MKPRTTIPTNPVLQVAAGIAVLALLLQMIVLQIWALGVLLWRVACIKIKSWSVG